MDHFRAMKAFIAVADAGSLSAAARRMGAPLANISRLLAQLEGQLDCVLIERTTRRMALTAAGRDYLDACRHVIETLEASEGRIAGQSEELAGTIAITAPVSFGRLQIVPLVAEFLSTHPRLDARLLLSDRNIDLVEEDIDVAVRIGDLRDSGLLAQRVGSLRLVAGAAPRLLKGRAIPSSPSDLADRPCITFSGLMQGGSRWVFKSKRHGRKAVRVHPRLNVNTAEAAVDAAISGVGVVRVLSYQAEAAIRAGQLVPLLQQFEDTAIPINLVYRATRSDTPRVKRFVEFAAARLRQHHQSRAR
ncbi:LysR family transcriptional regulator [Hyphomicrobium sp. xq]|uniref:LysR family transcriptional regulator n=1 Tax=Hyphomicrobium album TaxID=2665159 RepID=A0A6I3KMP9_9HYPH|nr:LysR family transcriptional regulator [Hyphomicrobium album]MTD95032.1 LysR family transcriptional regulator [Hyphomicrobium album]